MKVVTLMLELPDDTIEGSNFIYVVNKLLQSSDIEFRLKVVQEENIDEPF